MTDEDAISRAEAIRVASGYCHYTNIPDELAKLPSVNPKPCGDVISRQAVIDAIFSEPLYKTGLKERGAEEAVPAIFEKIKALPSVSAEKVGTDHWEKLWDELYDWLNDTRMSVAPDETVKDDIERHERLAQADMLDEVMECMLDLESRRDGGETDG